MLTAYSLALLLSQLGTEDTGQVQKTAEEFFKAISSGNGWLAAGIALMFVVWALREYGSKLSPKLETFLKNPLVSFALPFALSALTGLANAFFAGASPVEALSVAVKVAATAILTYVFSRKLAEAKSMGAAASAAVKTDADATAVFNERGPNP